MTKELHSGPSFRRGQRWSISLNVFVSTLSVLAIVVMVNFVGTRHFRVWDVTPKEESHLSPLTIRVLGAVTNRVKAIVFFDKRSAIFSSVSRLVDRMARRCPQLDVEYVDYVRFPARAEKVRGDYDLTADDEGDRVIFSSNGKVRVVNARDLSEFDYSELLTERRIKRVAFKGEQLFASALYGLINPEPVTVYFLQGHGEHDPSDTDDQRGYSKFAATLQESNIQIKPLHLMTGSIPEDCNLLVVASLGSPISAGEQEKIETFLGQGGRLLGLFGYNSSLQGMESILANWGIQIGRDFVLDRAQSQSDSPGELIVENFGEHSIVKPLRRYRLLLAAPRSIQSIASTAENREFHRAVSLALTGPDGVAFGLDRSSGIRFQGTVPVAVAVESEKGTGAGTDKRPTRIVAIGESLFLANLVIDQLANRDFGRLAVNWLLSRDLLLEGIGAQSIQEFTVTITESEMTFVRLLFLGVAPGGVFLLGSFVWYRRRV